jgi:hypothetical protein
VDLERTFDRIFDRVNRTRLEFLTENMKRGRGKPGKWWMAGFVEDFWTGLTEL